MYLFKVLRRQTIGIINIFSVVPESLLLTLYSLFVLDMESVAL